jgi:murein endopeptidase
VDNNDLADAVVDGWDEITVDDVATPGSFWLNPPHPKDDEGNRVDVYELMDYYEQQQQQQQGESHSTIVKLDTRPPSMHDDDDLARILADLDSL